MRRILIEIVGDEVVVYKPHESGAPAELLKRAAELGALSAGAAPMAEGRLADGSVPASAGKSAASRGRRPRSPAPKRSPSKASRRRRRSP
jgi:hypothetical protein